MKQDNLWIRNMIFVLLVYMTYCIRLFFVLDFFVLDFFGLAMFCCSFFQKHILQLITVIKNVQAKIICSYFIFYRVEKRF